MFDFAEKQIDVLTYCWGQITSLPPDLFDLVNHGLALPLEQLFS
jgi:hypothetical protein